MPILYEKCLANLEQGFRVYILVPDDRLIGTVLEPSLLDVVYYKRRFCADKQRFRRRRILIMQCFPGLVKTGLVFLYRCARWRRFQKRTAIETRQNFPGSCRNIELAGSFRRLAQYEQFRHINRLTTSAWMEAILAIYGEQNFNSSLWIRHWRYYARENYIIVIQDVRGRWMSEGEFVDIRPFNPDKKTNTDIDEASDTYDTIDWLIKNISNNNGNVGVFGNLLPGILFNNGRIERSSCIKGS